MPELPDEIARINALTTNARNTWFALLGVLVFVAITLMGVEHIDFYGTDRATQLPLVNVTVPTRYFFIAAPILTAAIYGYFHLYLIRLWDVLGDAQPQHDGRPLGDVISPWLVTDAALQLRRKRRGEDTPCNAHRTMETPATWLNIALAWAFGLIILFFIWWQSMPARNIVITGIAALCFLGSLHIGTASYVMLSRRMLLKRKGPPNLHRSVGFVGFMVFIAALILPLTWLRVTGIYDKNPNALAALAPLRLIDEEIVERPENWLPFEFARKEYRAAWCKRESIKNCGDLSKENKAAFTREWQSRRSADLNDMRRPDWHKAGRDKPDFRDADLSLSYLVGANLSGARMERANLGEAQMEGAILGGAQMEGAILIGARMEGADLSWAQMKGAYFNGAQMEGAILIGARMEGAILIEAQMKGAYFNGAQMEGANLSGAQMEGADLIGAKMKGAILRRAKMEGADLSRAKMEGANLSGAQMKGADLRGAQMEGAILSKAQMEGADLTFSHLAGTAKNPNNLSETNLRAAINNGGALRFVRFENTVFDSRTDFRNAFLDATVDMPRAFAMQMGAPDLPRPCQWVDAELSDEKFYSYWRWWVEKSPAPPPWGWIAPPEWRDVSLPTAEQLAKYNLTDCEWKPDPMPGPVK